MNELTPKERRHLLAEAMRTRKYTQGYGRLRQGERCFCAEGLACEIFHQQTGQGEWRDCGAGLWTFFFDDYNAQAVLLVKICEWYGLDAMAGIIHNGEKRSLCGLNDERYSFKDIATIIDNQPEAR